MIIDNIKNASFYYAMNPRMEMALRYLQDRDCSQLESGRHDISGDDCFALVSHYDTKPREAGIWEAHRRYIDVQYIVSGAEVMGWADLGKLEPATGYDEAKDIVFLKGHGDFLTIGAGTFLIFAPWDAHMPNLAIADPEPVIKVVVKVRV